MATMVYMKAEGVVRIERRIPFLLFVVCLVAAMPVSWGAGGVTNSSVLKQTRLNDGVSNDVSTKVTLCHVPPGNPANAHTIIVGEAAVPAHLAHGDYMGGCHIACNGVPSPVPKTGQTACWSVSWPYDPISCAGTGQDGEYQKGVAVDPRFTDNLDGTVRDNLTGLIWLKNAHCFNQGDWTTALSRANTLASGACGLSDGSAAGDWRLPNINELVSLIDRQNYNLALPTGHPFDGVLSYDYWSSSTHVEGTALVWFVGLFAGNTSLEIKFNFAELWPVRGGQ